MKLHRPTVAFLRRAVSAGLVLGALAWSGCKKPAPVDPRFRVMGTDAQTTAYREAIHTKMKALEKTLSIYLPDSELSAINRTASITRFPISKDTSRILLHAMNYHKLTDGAFDVTVAPLAALWGFYGGVAPFRPIPESLLKGALQGLGSDKVNVTEDSIFLKNRYTQIDLGGIAIGFAVDLSLIDVRQRGAGDILIRLGRSVRCLGAPKPTNVPHPFDEAALLGEVLLDGGQGFGASVPGDNRIRIGEETYGHIIDPRTGHPTSGTAMACVVGPTATECDALSTALVVLGVKEAPEVLPNFPRCEVLIVPDTQPLELWMTPGFKERFTFAEGLDAPINDLPVAVPEAEPAEEQ